MKCLDPVLMFPLVIIGYFAVVFLILKVQGNMARKMTRHENGNRHRCANGESHKYGILGGIFEGTVCLKCGFYDWTRNY